MTKKTTYPYREIGGRLKELRGARTQSDIARNLKVTLLTYQRYEYGERFPKGPVLSEIAALYGVSTDWILSGGKQQKPEEVQEHIDKANFEKESKITLTKVYERFVVLSERQFENEFGPEFAQLFREYLATKLFSLLRIDNKYRLTVFKLIEGKKTISDILIKKQRKK